MPDSPVSQWPEALPKEKMKQHFLIKLGEPKWMQALTTFYNFPHISEIYWREVRQQTGLWKMEWQSGPKYSGRT